MASQIHNGVPRALYALAAREKHYAPKKMYSAHERASDRAACSTHARGVARTKRIWSPPKKRRPARRSRRYAMYRAAVLCRVAVPTRSGVDSRTRRHAITICHDVFTTIRSGRLSRREKSSIDGHRKATSDGRFRSAS